MPFFNVYIQYYPETMGWEIAKVVPGGVFDPVEGAKRIVVEAADELGAYTKVVVHLNKSNERLKAMLDMAGAVTRVDGRFIKRYTDKHGQETNTGNVLGASQQRSGR